MAGLGYLFGLSNYGVGEQDPAEEDADDAPAPVMPPFGLQLEEPQIGPAGERARLLGHGSPSLRRPRVRDVGLERHVING